MKRICVTLAVVGAGLLPAGCGRAPNPWRESMTQVSTYEALQAGRYEGQLAISNLLAYGDTGLGTFEDLDGEMVVISGVVYQVAHTGVVSEAPPSVRTPFASVTWFEPDFLFDVGPMSQAVFENTMKWKNPEPDRIQALRINGIFQELTLRSVPRQAKPYPPLAQVVSEQQQVWDRESIAGTLVGYYIPPALAGAAPAGFHLHFLSADHQVGGHVMKFALAGGRIEVDTTPVAHVLLPPGAQASATP